jgi:hypothetical protein
MKTYIHIFLLLSMTVGCIGHGIAADLQTTNPWQQLFVNDLNAIYTSIKENHPGIYDRYNSQFKETVEKNYKKWKSDQSSY